MADEADPAAPPSPAMVYEALLGGHLTHAADRAVAAELEKTCPGLRELVRIQRRFAVEAAAWAGAMLGIGQFVDAGAGLPAAPAIHDGARRAQPDATVAYVDHDASVVLHLRAEFGAVAEYGAVEGIAIVEADVTDPDAVLADPGLRKVIDLERPAAVIFGGTLSSMARDVAGAAVAGFARRMARGSCVIAGCISYGDKALAERMASVFAGTGPFTNHGSEAIAGFFEGAGLRIVHGRPMDARCWPACPVTEERPAVQVLGGIGVRD